MDKETIKGYLLDTNHIAAVCRKDLAITRRIDALPKETPIFACAIALGEVEAGHQMNPTTNKKRRDEYVARLNERFLPEAIGISVNTRLYYAKIIGRLWVKCPPSSSKKKTERHLVEAFSVDINDVWSVAVAWEHGFIFLTHDKMEHIKDVLTEDEVKFDCWLPR